jgi:outer membrane biosynthesis protein TonB
MNAIDFATLQTLSRKELTELYNKLAATLGEKPVARFSDSATALKRTKKLVERVNEKPAAKAEPKPEPKAATKPEPKAATKPEPKAATKPEPKAATKPPRPRNMSFNFPCTPEQKLVRPGTNRAKLLELLATGATFDQCVAATWGKDQNMPENEQRKNTYEAIRLLHYYCGYGLRQGSDGVIHLINTP